MYEYTSVRSSTYDIDGLITQLNSKSAEGWDVVSVVPAGGELAAIMRRESETGSSGGMTATSGTSGVIAPEIVASVPPAAAEPAGWAAVVEPVAAAPVAAASAMVTTSIDPTPSPSPAPAASVDPAPSPSPAAAPPVQQVSTPATPAGWYPDPSGRFEMRYWDGSTWTEHVARGGQQFTDPPVA